MAHISKTASGNWKAVIRKTGWPMSSKTFRIKRDAEDWARRTEDEMVRGVFIRRAEAEQTTLKSALQRYLSEVTPTKRVSTQRQERSRAQTLIESLGQYSLAAITPDVIAKYRDQRLAGGRRRNGIFAKRSNNTVRLELALLGHLFTTAIREWRMGLLYNPVANVRKPSAGPGRTRRLSVEEEARLLAVVDQHTNPMLGWIVRIALETGMRLSEITHLRISQVDVERRIVRLTYTKNGSDRTVPLTRHATEIMKSALAHPVRPTDTDLIFYGEPGRNDVRGPYCFNRVWRRALESCAIKDFRFHDLRHEAVSRLVEGGLGDQEVAAISGHKSMQMLRRYTHLRAEDLVSRLDAIQLRSTAPIPDSENPSK